jgi:hypothetical protein
MPKKFFRKSFNFWLKHNRQHFKYPPIYTLKRKDHVKLRFSGITPSIVCGIGQHGSIGIYAYYQNELFDIITEFDVFEGRNSDGMYFCKECKPDYQKLFPSRQILWENHSFEPILKWANDTFKLSSWLCFYGKQNHWSAASIMDNFDKDKKNQSSMDLICATPVVIPMEGKG